MYENNCLVRISLKNSFVRYGERIQWRSKEGFSRNFDRIEKLSKWKFVEYNYKQ